MKNKIVGLSFISFIASIAGLVISFMLLKEDVTSTAHTLFEYFPMKYGVIPSSEWNGAIVLGLFTSVLQIVSASVMFSSSFSKQNRWLAFFAFIFSCGFDNWTDIVFRSGNLTGDVKVATITTLAFYTVGSEVLQGFSWLIFFTTWRQGISDFMWGMARLQAGFGSISSEWSNFKRAAARRESKEITDREPLEYNQAGYTNKNQSKTVNQYPYQHSKNKERNQEIDDPSLNLFQQTSSPSIREKMVGKSNHRN